jgi:hypothetical protein
MGGIGSGNHWQQRSRKTIEEVAKIDLREVTYEFPLVTEWRSAGSPSPGLDVVFRDNVTEMEIAVRNEDLVTKQAGFSLHDGRSDASVACKSHQRKKLERLCRYITRPAIAERRLSLANNGNVVIALKTPYDDGTTGTPSPMSCSVPWNSWGGWRRWYPGHG